MTAASREIGGSFAVGFVIVGTSMAGVLQSTVTWNEDILGVVVL